MNWKKYCEFNLHDGEYVFRGCFGEETSVPLKFVPSKMSVSFSEGWAEM